MKIPSAVLPVLLSVTAAALFFACRPGYWITDAGNKEIIVRTILAHGTDAIASPAAELDPQGRFFPDGGFHFQRFGKQIFSVFPVFFPAICTPLYAIFGRIGLFFWPLAGGLATLIFAAKFYRQVRASDALLWVLAWSTPLAFYSAAFWEMTLASALAAAGLLLLARRPPRGEIFAGILFGTGLIFREEFYVLGAALGLVLLLEKQFRTLWKIAAGALPFAAGLWTFQFLRYGHIFGIHGGSYYTHNASLAPETPAEFLLKHLYGFFHYLLECNVLELNFSGWEILFLLPFAAAILFGFCKEHLKLKRAIAAAAAIASGAMLWFMMRRNDGALGCVMQAGLLPSLPFCVCALLESRTLWNTPTIFLRCAFRLCVFYTLGLVPLLTLTDFGIIWGARHFLILAPAFVWLSYESARRIGAMRWFVVLAILGGILQLRGFTLLAQTKTGMSTMERTLARESSDVIVTDAFFLPESTPELFFRRRILFTRQQGDLVRIVSLLREKGIRNFLFATPAKTTMRKVGNEELQAFTRQVRFVRPPVRADAPGAEFLSLYLFECKTGETP